MQIDEILGLKQEIRPPFHTLLSILRCSTKFMFRTGSSVSFSATNPSKTSEWRVEMRMRSGAIWCQYVMVAVVALKAYCLAPTFSFQLDRGNIPEASISIYNPPARLPQSRRRSHADPAFNPAFLAAGNSDPVHSGAVSLGSN